MCYTSINNKNHDHHHQKRSNGKKKQIKTNTENFFFLLKVTSNTVFVFNVPLVSAEVCELVCYLLLG